jgi:hypothetical protein
LDHVDLFKFHGLHQRRPYEATHEHSSAKFWATFCDWTRKHDGLA